MYGQWEKSIQTLYLISGDKVTRKQPNTSSAADKFVEW